MEIRSQALVCDLQTNQLQAAVNDPSKGSQLVILLILAFTRQKESLCSSRLVIMAEAK